jgi:hypothetical protein
MENWRWTENRSADEIADYIAYALKAIQAVGLPCEGITTPGGFGDNARPQLAQATLQACRDVFHTEIPHYFRHLYTDDRSVAPRVEYATGLDGDDPRCVVSIIGCTGDWFGGWDGLEPGHPDQFITEDGKSGRLPEVIARGEPAILVCHWPGIYFNGREVGFTIFKEVVRRLNAHYDNLVWMKNSEIARYWAARELTRIEREEGGFRFHAPFGTPGFTIEVESWTGGAPGIVLGGEGRPRPLTEVGRPSLLAPGTWCRCEAGVRACFDLPRGASRLRAVPA